MLRCIIPVASSRRTRSAAPVCHSPYRSAARAQRNSIATLRPSTKPVSPKPPRKADTRSVAGSGEPASIYPITGIAGSCARAASGHPSATPPSSVMNSRGGLHHQYAGREFPTGTGRVGGCHHHLWRMTEDVSGTRSKMRGTLTIHAMCTTNPDSEVGMRLNVFWVLHWTPPRRSSPRRSYRQWSGRTR